MTAQPPVDFAKAIASIERLYELYERLKEMEAKGGNEDAFRSMISDVRDELNRLPHQIALLGNLTGARALTARSKDVEYWINFVLTTSPVNVKKASAIVLGSAGLSSIMAELEVLLEFLQQLRARRDMLKKP